MADVRVRASRLRVMGVSLMPQGVKLRRNPVIGTRARLIPMLRAIRSMLSISLVGNRALMKVYPGSHRTKMAPSTYLIYMKG